MPITLPPLTALMNALDILCEHRRRDDIDPETWDDVHWAMLAVDEAPPETAMPRLEFQDGVLKRIGMLESGTPDVHPCRLVDFESIAVRIESCGANWFVIDDLATACELAWLTAMTAVEFLEARQLVRRTGTAQRFEAVHGFTLEQALAEYTVADISAGEEAKTRRS